jgi:hypothetical protein
LRNRIAALDSVSGQATVWDPGTAGTGQFAVFALARLGSVICAGGSFTTLDGEFRNRLGALDTLTSLATSWNPNADQTVRALAFSQDAIYAGATLPPTGQPNAYFAAFTISRDSIRAPSTACGRKRQVPPDRRRCVWKHSAHSVSDDLASW